VQPSLPSPRYEEFSGLCGVLKCGQSRIKWYGGPWQFSLSGPYDVFPDVIICKNYVYADSQRSRLLFVVVENVLTQLHIHLAARVYFLIPARNQGSQTQIALWST